MKGRRNFEMFFYFIFILFYYFRNYILFDFIKHIVINETTNFIIKIEFLFYILLNLKQTKYLKI